MLIDVSKEPISFSRGRTASRSPWLIGLICMLTAGAVGYLAWPRETRPRLKLQPVASRTVSAGQTLSVQLVPWCDRPINARLEYGVIAGPESARINSQTGLWEWRPDKASSGKKVRVKLGARNMVPPIQQAVCEFTITVRDALASPDTEPDYDGPSILGGARAIPPDELPADDADVIAPQFTVTGQRVEPLDAVDQPRINKPSTGQELHDDTVQELEKLYQAGMLCQPATYPTLRRLFAERFARLHAADLKTAFQGSGADLEGWLKQHLEQRDELFTAFDEGDDVVAAIRIVERLHAKSFSRLIEHFELAIATAVTWDREFGVCDYSFHQRRSHAIVAKEKTCDAIDNFEYYSDPDYVAERRIRRLPWEFLTHVVNHRTPLTERAWALRTYYGFGRPIGQCYDDVAYDNQMIKSGETTSNMAGREYTLPNLKEFGGICAMQADYASRVSKCLGIPAAYVQGFGRSGVNHAWVMWTGLGPATESGLSLSLESHGRFFIDRYYVGQLTEPQFGRPITDRELELQLQAVGLNPLAHRQAKLIMLGWPDLRRKLALTTEQQLDFLESVTTLSPGNQSAWLEIAELAPAGKIGDELQQRMDGLRDRCLKNFANSPDFICQIIDDLLAYEELPQRLPVYDRLLQLWSNTGRPDLACRLRLQMTEQLVKDKQYQAALGGLAQTMKRFPDEGRYVPNLLDKYEEVARQVEDGAAKVTKMYQDLLPLIPRRRQGQTSVYFMSMLDRAARHFRQAGDVKAADAYAGQLKKLKAK